MPARLPDPQTAAPRPPVTPDEASWARMHQAQRQAFIDEVLAFHSDPANFMAESRPHRRAKSRALDELSLHFSELNRPIYLADEMAVLYPGEDSFVPDLLAVLDVPQVEPDDRDAWIVQDEGKGLDLVLEVLHKGNRSKDLEHNVGWYAKLGIAEYFVYDSLHRHLHGYRLIVGSRRYQPIRPRLSRFTSQVLGLDLAVVDDGLHFFAGHAELIGSGELISRLATRMERVQARAEQEAARAEQEAARAEQAEVRALRQALMTVVGARGLEGAELAARIAGCEDTAALLRCLAAASTAQSAGSLLPLLG